MEPETQPPRVLISYTHDSPEHEARVLALSDRLRSDGIDAVLDQYEIFPKRGWIQWMNQQLEQVQFVLIVCTETYRRRAAGEERPGVGLGAVHESRRIKQALYDDGGVNERFIPVLMSAQDRPSILPELRDYTHFLISGDAGYEALYGLLTNQPKVTKPVLGKLRALQPREAKPDSRNSSWNVPPRNTVFTGRETYLKTLHQNLAQTNAVALSGIGGMGKTQIAIEYAHRYRGHYQFVLWAGADDAASLLSGFATLANTLDLPEKSEKELSAVAASVTQWLESHSGWLLILDNIDTVEDLNFVYKLIPSGSSGHLLITTRLNNAGARAKCVELNKMEPKEGALFLLRRSGLAAADQELAERISKEVDGLPLALDQAGAFIQETPSTLAEYLTLYRAEGTRLRKLGGDIDAQHPSVTVTFSLAFSRLAAKNPAAAGLVRACAFFAPDAIPEDIFALREFRGKPLDFAEAVRDAGRFALIRRNASAKTLDMHRQVQEVIKDEMDAENRRRWTERVVAALSAFLPPPEFQNWNLYETLLPHTLTAARHIKASGLDSRPAARLLNDIAHYLQDRAEYTEAESLYLGAVAIYEKAADDYPNTATSISNLASLYRRQRRYGEAEVLHLRALAIRKEKLGKDDLATAASINDLALLYGDQCRYREAEQLLERALHIYQAQLGPGHAEVATSLNNLASLYYRQGHYEQAEPLFQRALAIRENALRSGHPSTATSLHNLAALYYRQGRYKDAAPLCKRAFDIRQKALGPDHPDTIETNEGYTALLQQMGRHEEAKAVEARRGRKPHPRKLD